MDALQFSNTIPLYTTPSITVKRGLVDQYRDFNTLTNYENIAPHLLGITVELLTKYSLSVQLKLKVNPFILSGKKYKKDDNLLNIIQKINGIDDDSIYHAYLLACHISTSSKGISLYASHTEFIPNRETLNDIRIMVVRSVKFFIDNHVIGINKRFLKGYTDVVKTGSCNFVCQSGIADLKVFRGKCTGRDFLEVYIYHLLALNADYNLKKHNARTFKELIIFNPREYCAYRFDINNIVKKDKDLIMRKGRFTIYQ